MPPRGLQDRADITGLRGVSVFLVVLFHLGTRFKGGFVGVDVFFVISGYLISSVILGELSTGTFSFFNFYERRVRRILPAFFAMLILTSALGWRYLTPAELEAYGRSQLAALFCVSNVFFHDQAGYFASPSTLTPLLHTWSLGVEEQFYLVFPVLIVAVYQLYRRMLTPVLCLVAAVSLAAAAVTINHDANSAFFYAPLRAWEFLVGALLACDCLPKIYGVISRNLLSFAGLMLILGAALRYDGGNLFPGVAALVPCVGAAMIIAAGETGSSLVGAMLSLRPVVFLGLISYSIYLLHWPLLVFQRTDRILFAQAEFTTVTRIFFLMLVVVIATLSWVFLEQPIRRGRFRPPPRVLMSVAASVMFLLVVTSAALAHRTEFRNAFRWLRSGWASSPTTIGALPRETDFVTCSLPQLLRTSIPILACCSILAASRFCLRATAMQRHFIRGLPKSSKRMTFCRPMSRRAGRRCWSLREVPGYAAISIRSSSAATCRHITSMLCCLPRSGRRATSAR